MCNFHVRWWHVKLQIKSETDFEPSLSRCLLPLPFKTKAQSHPPRKHALVSHFKFKQREGSCCGEVCVGRAVPGCSTSLNWELWKCHPLGVLG